MTTTAELLAGAGGSKLLPTDVANEIWNVAFETASIPKLAKSYPMTLDDTVFPTLTKSPEAFIVGESEAKKGADIAFGSIQANHLKAVVGLAFPMETLLKNPGRVLDDLSAHMSAALARQIDLAILHGKIAGNLEDIRKAEGILATDIENTVEVPNDGDLDKLLWDGAGLVAKNGRTIDGILADSSLGFRLAASRDKEGRRLHPEISLNQGELTRFDGVPLVSTGVVGGKLADTSFDTDLLAVAGDWTKLRFGRALDIKLKRVEYGDPLNRGRDLQGHNEIAFMAETIFGWATLDPGAFVKFTKAA